MEKSTQYRYQAFLESYDETTINEIWKKQQRKFLKFWNSRIMDTTSPPLTDHEIDEIIRILDKNGKGNTKKDHAVAKAMIPQFKWRTIFRNIRDYESHSMRINKILTTKNPEIKIALLDELKEANNHWRNSLTGPSANAINCIIAAANPFENLSIISLNDRRKLMEHLGYQKLDTYDELSWGSQIIESETFILNQMKSNGITANARTISSFVYASEFIDQWRQNGDEDSIVEEGESSYGNKTKVRFWMFAPGPGASQWEDNYKNGYMALGWPETGDLNNYDDIESIRSFFQKTNNTESSFMNSVRATYEFNRVISPGDIVVVKKGQSEFLGYGIVKSDYYYDPNKKDYNHLRNVEWKKRGSWKLAEGKVAVKTLTDITKYPDFVNELIKLMEIDVEIDLPIINNPKNNVSKIPLNTILFGPPGTGKTYSTIEFAVRAIADHNEDFLSRNEVKNEYEILVRNERIVFTTVHQSLSYEDFIEGIKPNIAEPTKDGLAYEIQSGIFKTACAKAAFLCYQAYRRSQKNDIGYEFDELYDAFLNDLHDKLSENIEPVFKSIKGRDIGVKDINKNDSIIARKVNSMSSSSAPLTKENIQKLYDKFKSVEEIEDLRQIKETLETTTRITEFYAIFSGLKQFEETFKGNSTSESNEYYDSNINSDEIIRKFEAGVFDEAVLKYHFIAPKCMVILDEINRGNISQIFGELITLLEHDKRWGHTEGLSIILPYSKKRFYVPANLLIVGTMNTADRSVEALDTALRRRFDFIEKKPDYELEQLQNEVANYSLAEMLRTLNRRIEKLLDKDHQLGHSYLINVGESIDALKLVFKNKFIPLLQEYFFGDYSRLGLVLGEKFFMPAIDDDNLFASFRDVDTTDFINRPTYQLRDLDLMSDDEFEEAIHVMMKKA